MSKLSKLMKKLGALLARTEAEIANTHAVGEALVGRADEVERVRLRDVERLREMLQAESEPYKLRGLEQQYLEALVDLGRARRVGRYERDLKLGREEQRARVGAPLVGV